MDRRTFVDTASAVSAAALATGLVRPRAALGAARAETERLRLLASRAAADRRPDPSIGVRLGSERGGAERARAYAKRLNADLIIVGHRRPKGWAERWWRGSIGATLMDDAPCSVLIAMTGGVR